MLPENSQTRVFDRSITTMHVEACCEREWLNDAHGAAAIEDKNTVLIQTSKSTCRPWPTNEQKVLQSNRKL